jgi:hypothetical protein
MSEDTSITVDEPSELFHAVGKAAGYAVSSGQMVWLYSDGIMFYASFHYPPEGKEKVALCYPGGRNVLYRKGAKS